MIVQNARNVGGHFVARRPECLCKLDPKFQLPFYCDDKEEVGQYRSVSDGILCAFSREKLVRNTHRWCISFSLCPNRSYNLIGSGRVKLAPSGDRWRTGKRWRHKKAWRKHEETGGSFNGALVWKVMIVAWMSDRFNANVARWLWCQG